MERVRRIDNVLDVLDKRWTEIDETVDGFDEIASQMADDLGIPRPTTIQSTPIPAQYIVDGQIRGFSATSMIRRSQALEQQAQQRYQILGLRIIGAGFAVQLTASVLRFLFL